MLLLQYHSSSAQLEVVGFWCQMKAPIFLITAKLITKLIQIYYTYKVIAETVPVCGIPILIFFGSFITALYPVPHTYFCPGRENKKQP